jgi:hypothetical protein
MANSIDPNFDVNQFSYNKFETLPNIPYSIVSYLIDQDDYIWKLLYYNSADAWKDSKTSLTATQKGLLVYDGVRPINDCRVFLDTGADDSWLVESTMLRCSVIEGVPSNYVYGTLYMALEIYTHYKVNSMSNLQPRNLAIAQRLIEVLNGADIDGVGRLYFDVKASSRCRLSLAVGQIPYKGLSIIMATKAL